VDYDLHKMSLLINKYRQFLRVYGDLFCRKNYVLFATHGEVFYKIRQLFYGIEQAGLQDGFLDLAARSVHDLEMGLAGAVFPLLLDIQAPVTQRHDFLDLPQAKLTSRDRISQVALRRDILHIKLFTCQPDADVAGLLNYLLDNSCHTPTSLLGSSRP